MTNWASDLRLGPYQLVTPIGAGGMGEVWKARDTRLDRFVAVKRLLSPSPPRFEIEARAIAALNHPHICQIYDVGPDYLVLEYVNGRPLRGPLAADAAVRLARQVANALEAAHAKGILHRDLKPSNVLVTEDGTAKLLDFGVAKLVSTDRDATRTQDGTVVGTAAYMSPEQAQGQPIDVRSEVFSFGAVLYELLAGRRAFEGAVNRGGAERGAAGRAASACGPDRARRDCAPMSAEGPGAAVSHDDRRAGGVRRDSGGSGRRVTNHQLRCCPSRT